MIKKGMHIEDWQKLRDADWFDYVTDFEAVKKVHAQNVANCKNAVEEYKQTDRPLRILAVHGSARSSGKSAAAEISNSMMFLQECLKIVPEIDPNIEIDQVALRDYNIEPCNGCLSTTSALCNFPCTCFPLDPMQKLYPKVLRSDIILCSTPVNQSAMSTRLKAFCDRLISLDGGFFIDVDQFAPKDMDFKSKMMAISASGAFAYDQRLFGRVAAYFISSKDEHNPNRSVNHLPDKRMDAVGYIEHVAYALRDNFESYGIFHHKNYFASFAAEPMIEYMWDKETLAKSKDSFRNGEQVVRNAIEFAQELKKAPPKFKTERYNRT
jgi:multimeric flavodoxin WrbA